MLHLEVNLLDLINQTSICYSCFSKLEVIYKKQLVDKVEILFLYRYSDFFRSLIYQLKGAYDIMLSSVFLSYYKEELKIKYFNYTIVPMPSNIDEDQKRGFNHVIEIFKSLNLPVVELFYKKQKWKQSDHSFKQRSGIRNILAIKKGVKIPDNVLLVDDVYTSGSTIKFAIFLLKKYRLKHIKGLILAQTFK